METVSMSELRTHLVDIRAKISNMVPELASAITERIKAKSAHKAALAKAKIKALQMATCKEEKTPTMINAVAETMIESEQKALDTAEVWEIALKLKIDALEEECKAIKKAMSTIESEMRTFGG